MSETVLDRAHAAMTAAPEDGAARLRFYGRLAEIEVFLLLAADPAGDRITPRIFDTRQGRFAVIFDREERLAEFAEGPAPYAALSGRAVAAMIAPGGTGLGVNLGVASSSILIPAEAVAWLAETLAKRPDEIHERPQSLSAPSALPGAIITALDAKLPAAAGLARYACLCAVAYRGGARGHLLGFVGARPGSEQALARAVAEALIFSGHEAAALDVAFFDASDPIVARLARVGLRFDLPEPEMPGAPIPPGTDPDTPPRLR